MKTDLNVVEDGVKINNYQLNTHSRNQSINNQETAKKTFRRKKHSVPIAKT